ncbi:MAG: AMP-dependent synthetase/ligase [Minwuia sp.]|uniref:AMP-dependent synthetase/ligase n=1 Tax=Minwuia sp. TaxID=2493630 RepID=UPI003A85426A
MFWTRVQKWASRTAMRKKEYGIWQKISWADFGREAQGVGIALDQMGIGKGDVVCVLSNTLPEWMYADMGVQCIGAVCAGIYPTDAAAQVEYLVNDSKCRVIFVEDEEQLDKVLSIRGNCPTLEKIVIFDMEGLEKFDDQMAESYESFRDRGLQAAQGHDSRWQDMLKAAEPGDLAILVYTSGTTGPPKGAMISHNNLVFQIVNGTQILPQETNGERMAFLPLCHVAERTLTYFSLYTGNIANFVESPETVFENIQEIQPTTFFAVPRIWEKLFSTINIAVKDATSFQKLAYKTALGWGYAVADKKLAGEEPSGIEKLRFRIGDFLVLRNIKTLMGLSRVDWVGTGAAPISPELIRWYMALGIEMLELYGQTENTGLATTNVPGDIKLGFVGKSVPYGETRISPEGEILLKGHHIFMGYLGQPEKTAETIVDGWLHTGDVGHMDNQGYVKITDRMKDIIITAGGKNITPSEIENELKFSPYVADAVVIGDRRKFLTALIMLDQENVEKFAQDNDIAFTSFASLARAQAVIELIDGIVEAANTKFAQVETIKKFRLIDKQLDPEDEEVTPTMKLKRSFVEKKYQDLIDGMYADAA